MEPTSHEKKQQRRIEKEQQRQAQRRARYGAMAKKKAITYSMLLAGLIIAVSAVIWLTQPGEIAPGDYDNFSMCITEKGAIMYGTEWCPHCQNQKAMFGNSFQFVNYVDCDASAGICAAEGVTGYPTWKFSDGTSVSGTQPLSELARKTGCQVA